MAVIAFSKDPAQIWCKAGWAFRQVMDDILTLHSNDSALNAELKAAKGVKGLSIYLMDSDLAAKVTNAIRDTVTRILAEEIRSGILDQEHGDAMTVMQYRDALRELLKALFEKPSIWLSNISGKRTKKTRFDQYMRQGAIAPDALYFGASGSANFA